LAGPNGKSRSMNVAMQARYKGRQFIVNLRAVKGVFGLVQAPVKLDDGGKMILQLSGAERALRTVQLFVTIERKYHMESTFVLSLDKVVSPTGTTGLLSFLSDALGIKQDSDLFLMDGPVDGEMVYYEFKSAELHMPNRGKVLSRLAAEQARARRREEEAAEELETARLARDFVANGGSTGGAVAAEESDELVEMYGIKVSKKNLERLENLSVRSEDRLGANGRPIRAAPRPTPPVPAGAGEEESKSPGKLSSMLRKLASKLGEE
jgi:hypothetical protein